MFLDLPVPGGVDADGVVALLELPQLSQLLVDEAVDPVQLLSHKVYLPLTVLQLLHNAPVILQLHLEALYLLAPVLILSRQVPNAAIQPLYFFLEFLVRSYLFRQGSLHL